MKGMGCDNEKVATALASISNAQRLEVLKSYDHKFGRVSLIVSRCCCSESTAYFFSTTLQDLLKDLKGELYSDFERLALALFVPKEDYEVTCVNSTWGVSASPCGCASVAARRD